MVADQLKELKLGELLETPPPGLDEAVAISKVVQFVNSQVRYGCLLSVTCGCECCVCRCAFVFKLGCLNKGCPFSTKL